MLILFGWSAEVEEERCCCQVTRYSAHFSTVALKEATSPCVERPNRTLYVAKYLRSKNGFQDGLELLFLHQFDT